MSRRLSALDRLEGDQLAASAPRQHAALSASAGTGKTHVLTARVLRLLLSGVEPSAILCLTFTKAGAAEMAERIHARLAHWVRLKEEDLGAELIALGEDHGPKMRARARTLFAHVLDARGGGLRIQTIHAFAQGLLAAFPAEAGLTPGFRPLDAREEQMLARSTLAELLVRAEQGSDLPLIRDLQALSHRMGEGGAEDFLRACARAPDALAALGAREGIQPRLRRAFDLPPGDIDEAVAEQCCDEVFDVASLRRIGLLNGQWGTKKGLRRASLCEQWIGATASERVHLIEELHEVWAKKGGQEILSFAKGHAPQDEDYEALATRAFECCSALLRLRRTAAMVDCLAAGLRAGQTFAAAYAAAKRAQGAVDFDDLIRWAERLLLEPGMGEWVRYKLDQATDHILVDEAQDTNEAQWNIVRAIASDYFAGAGASERHRTIFTVGDYKQAIFGFQGTDPQSFDVARAWFDREARGVGRKFLDLSMDRSFRSAPPILALVDRVIGDLGHEALGLPRRPNAHESHHARRAGSVTLWDPFTSEAAEPEDEAGDEGWVPDTVRRYASRLARQIKAWLDEPFHVASRGRALRPEDILILVRRRSDLASLIVARLHAEGVPVAGVDRLLLSAPLAVQDLLAAARFAVQPLDDLNLAALLVSPLFGWSQDQLFASAYGRDGMPLWQSLRNRPGARAETIQGLQSLLAMADFATPHAFFETILSGPLAGRRRLLERLGEEAADPIDELLAGALDFETSGTPSLEAFLDWFARGDVEIVRDPSVPLDAVRVMTVHGSKGLQSPVLILADACADPDRKGGGRSLARLTLPDDGTTIPILRPRKDELSEPLKAQIEARDALDREEHWRLLYVALTRAEERLYIGGALGPADRNGPPAASWYAAVKMALEGLGCASSEDRLWGHSLRLGDAERPAAAERRRALPEPALPAWLLSTAPAEPRPPRPLAPSVSVGEDVPEPPPGPEARQAAVRGKLLHALFERLPEVSEPERASAADLWLERSAGVADAAFRAALADDACRIIADPRFADLFGPDSLSEAPIAAVVAGGQVVAGTVDRLLVGKERVLVADFKTGRSVPARAGEIPAAHLRQMAAYVAALRVIFPDKSIEAALLYTSGPRLHLLDEALLAPFAPGAAAA